jgi:16S rRNA (cytosine967-C5)-methyltransferase
MTARELALRVLRDDRHFARDRLDDALRRTSLSPADRGLATELVYGTLRRRGSLDVLLAVHTNRARERVADDVWELLRLGAYQLVYLSHVPPHAAINETVELARFIGQTKATGFVNGVLRGLSRSLTDDTVSAPAADAMPVKNGVYRQLTRPILPDPETHAAEYVAAGLSLPHWLVGRWLERYGWDETLRLGFWFAEPGPLWIRTNPLKTTRDEARRAFASTVAAEPGPHPQSLKIAGHVPIRSLPGYAEGWFSVQDLSAMAAATALAPEPGMTVLDLCAAPGGKTSHLAELMRNTGRIVACDVNERRLRTVEQLCSRLGITIVETRHLASRGRMPLEKSARAHIGGSPDYYDAALVDVLCSNTGVLGRRPEVRWRLTPDDFRELVPLQADLLRAACEAVRPGGRVVYSTCSIEPEENAGVVRTVLTQLSGWKLEEEHEHRSGLPADGGYWSRLRRSG